MITVDKKQGMAVDYARIYKGTESEPDDDGKEIVVTLTIGDDDDFILEWTDGPHRSRTQLFIPFERLKKLVLEA